MHHTPDVKHTNCSELEERLSFRHKDAFRDGKVKVIRSHSKIDVKIISVGTFVSLLMFACKEKMSDVSISNS